MQTEFVFLKIPKLWQIFGKIGLGNPPRARNIQKTRCQTQQKDLPSDSGPMWTLWWIQKSDRRMWKIQNNGNAKRKFPKFVFGKSPKNVAKFWENWARGKSPKIVANFWEVRLGVKVPKLWQFFAKLASGNSARARQIQKTHVQTQLKDLPSDSGPGRNRTPDQP